MMRVHPHDLITPKAPSPNTITSTVRVSTYEIWWEHKHSAYSTLCTTFPGTQCVPSLLPLGPVMFVTLVQHLATAHGKLWIPQVCKIHNKPSALRSKVTRTSVGTLQCLTFVGKKRTPSLFKRNSIFFPIYSLNNFYSKTVQFKKTLIARLAWLSS